MATAQGDWARDILEVVGLWQECCQIPAKAIREYQRFVVQQVWHEYSHVLAYVAPETRHISIIGDGIYPKIQELRHLAIHAFGTELGEALFPPLTVRLDGADMRFRWVGHGCILGFADTGSGPPRRDTPAVLLATLATGYALVAVHESRALLIAQGRLKEITGLDLDRLTVWAKLRAQAREFGRLEEPGTDERRGRRTSGNDPARPSFRSSHDPRSDMVDLRADPVRVAALLALALQASVVDAIPAGTRGRQELPSFLNDIVELARRGAPEPIGSAAEIAARIGAALGKAPRPHRATYALLVLLENHGRESKSLTLVSRPSPHQWQVHSTDLAHSETGVVETLLARWPALQAMLDGDDTPVSDEEVDRMKIRGGQGGARGIVKKRNEAPYLYSCAFTQEYNLRHERERQLLQVRAEHADLAIQHRNVLDALQQQLDQAKAENAQRAEHEHALNTRVERVEHAEQRIRIRMAQIFALETAAANCTRNKDLAMRFIETMDCGDWPTVEALLAPDVVLHDEGDDIRGLAGALHRMRQNQALARNAATIAAVVAEGDLVAVRWDIPGASIQFLRLCEDHITEAWCSSAGQHER